MDSQKESEMDSQKESEMDGHMFIHQSLDVCSGRMFPSPSQASCMRMGEFCNEL